MAVLIDADNIGPSSAGDVFRIACRLGDPILRRAYGTPQRFMGAGGWQNAQHEYGIVSKPQISNLSGKNAADIALVIDAMECLYRVPCDAICIVSNDSDYTALAAKLREAGKRVYGIGSAKAPESFRSACTQYIVLPKTAKAKEKTASEKREAVCPRCGGKLEQAFTKSRKACLVCAQCGGMSTKVGMLRAAFDAESVTAILSNARSQLAPGCSCPSCGGQMGIVRVASGKRAVEIDVCGTCGSVWYDKDEFETLIPADGLLSANVSAGKAFRRDVTAALAADLRNGRVVVKTLGSLRSVLTQRFHVPKPDVQVIVSSLLSQKVLTVQKNGAVTVSGEVSA
ncbi:MAG: NYN domain-containing protein [bacterium]|nr:NYN domain-containing protein [bacterium]